MATIEITKENLKSTIEQNNIVFLDFWADWCGPCKQFGPVFEKASEKHPDIVFGKVNTETQPEVAAAFGIQSIPTLAIFKKGKLIFMQPGALPANLLEQIITKVRQLDLPEEDDEEQPPMEEDQVEERESDTASKNQNQASGKVVTSMVMGEGLAMMADDYGLRRQGVTREFLERANSVPVAKKALEFYSNLKKAMEDGNQEQLKLLSSSWASFSEEINKELATLDADTRSEIRGVLRAIEQLLKS